MNTEIKVGTTCNNRCVFCLNENRTDKRSTEDILKEIQRCEGFDEVQFTGGETTIREDFFKLVGETRKKGMQTTIHTNGRVLSYEWFVRQLGPYKPLYFLISFHAHTPALYKEYARTDGYAQVMKGIENLKKEGIPFSINIVINRYNIDFIDAIAEHHANLQPNMLQMSWVRPQGEALKNQDVLIPFSRGQEKVRKAIEILLEKKQPFGLIGIPFCILPEYNQYKKDPYANMLVGDAKANEILLERKKILNECQTCIHKSSCGGIYKDYPDSFSEDIKGVEN